MCLFTAFAFLDTVSIFIYIYTYIFGQTPPRTIIAAIYLIYGILTMYLICQLCPKTLKKHNKKTNLKPKPKKESKINQRKLMRDPQTKTVHDESIQFLWCFLFFWFWFFWFWSARLSPGPLLVPHLLHVMHSNQPCSLSWFPALQNEIRSGFAFHHAVRGRWEHSPLSRRPLQWGHLVLVPFANGIGSPSQIDTCGIARPSSIQMVPGHTSYRCPESCMAMLFTKKEDEGCGQNSLGQTSLHKALDPYSTRRQEVDSQGRGPDH